MQKLRIVDTKREGSAVFCLKSATNLSSYKIISKLIIDIFVKLSFWIRWYLKSNVFDTD